MGLDAKHERERERERAVRRGRGELRGSRSRREREKSSTSPLTPNLKKIALSINPDFVPLSHPTLCHRILFYLIQPSDIVSYSISPDPLSFHPILSYPTLCHRILFYLI